MTSSLSCTLKSILIANFESKGWMNHMNLSGTLRWWSSSFVIMFNSSADALGVVFVDIPYEWRARSHLQNVLLWGLSRLGVMGVEVGSICSYILSIDLFIFLYGLNKSWAKSSNMQELTSTTSSIALEEVHHSNLYIISNIAAA